MKVTITTWYEIEESDVDFHRLKAETTMQVSDGPNTNGELQGLFNLHDEKLGKIERKLLQ